MKSPERLMQIKTTGVRTIGKVLLWILVIFLLFKGAVSILDNKSLSEMVKSIETYRIAAEQRDEARSGAAAFAVNFIYEYYSFDGAANSDYQDRTGAYLAGSLDIQKPAGSGIATEVLSANAVKISFASKNRMDVDISAKIRYTSLTGGAILSKNLKIRVPVGYQDGKYAVDASPMLIPKEDAADIMQAEGYSGTEISSAEKDEIKQVLESFFKTYYEGSDQEVSYYVSDQSKIKHGLNGAVTFNKLNTISAYYLAESKEYLVSATLTVNDNGEEIRQNMYLYLIKGEDKYYINQISTRVK